MQHDMTLQMQRDVSLECDVLAATSPPGSDTGIAFTSCTRQDNFSENMYISWKFRENESIHQLQKIQCEVADDTFRN